MYMQLKEKRGQKFDTPRLRLWTRTICRKLQDDLDKPPDLPAFRGNSQTPKKLQHETLSNALTRAFAHAFTSQNTFEKSEPPVAAAGMSPGKVVELCMKNFEQLRYLHSYTKMVSLQQKSLKNRKRKYC